MITHLIFNCMFVVQEYPRAISNLHIYDKSLPMGSYSERLAVHLLDVLATLRVTAHTNFFNMQEKKEIVATTSLSKECAQACLLIKQMGSKKDVYNQLFHVFTDAHNNQTSEIHGFFESGYRYELFKGIRDLINHVSKISKEDLDELVRKID